MTTATGAATLLLMYAVLPVWILAGFADYWCHRVTRIEENAGTFESALHFLQFGSIAVPTLFALFFEINALFFLIAAVAIILHHLVAFTDVRYANSARGIPPIEQMVHSFLEIMPITAFLLLAVTHGTQLLALVGAGQTAPDFAFHAKVNPLPFWYLFSAVGGATLLNFIPYTEEFLRCRRAAAALKRSERH